jgi:pantoate--beta-alanine ligase
MTQVFKAVAEWLEFKKTIVGQSLGFVPTMGALHSGHLSLMQQSLKENDLTMVSIFVNPTQFNDPKDLLKYPRTPEKDLEMIQSMGVPFLLMPEQHELYAEGYRYQVSENVESRVLCGAHRPGHFDGVLTVVLKLLNLTQATRAYFGEKDFQQLTLIRGMVDAFFIPTQIIGCPTLRESDGLAMSSRNVRLNEDQRRLAPEFFKALKESSTPDEARVRLEGHGFEVDYVEDRYQRRLSAVRLGEVRLIDNVAKE